ncbi:MAG: cation-translocating P-type ATPase [Christensenellales bacterium]
MEEAAMHYLQPIDLVLERVQSTASGLSAAEAERRLAQHGKNKLKAAEKETLLARFLGELKDPMLIILMAAAVVSGVTSLLSGESLAESLIIMIVVLLNAVLGVYQESKAEKAIEALQVMSAATSNVLRGGHIVQIRSEDLVVGDVVLLEAGTAVPADCRLIESASVQIEEAALTGESVPVQKSIEALRLTGEAKDVPLGDRTNMAYMGSTVVYGRGRAVVVDTGMDTQMGKIADAISSTVEGDTPLQIKLNRLSRSLSWMVLAICAFIFVFSILRSGDFSLPAILETFLVAVSLAVAAIPEGLATVVTIVLSIGVTNMSKRNAVIRRLTAVETLGSTQIICSDKTGTLTQNKMTVVQQESRDDRLLARALALCSDSEWENEQALGEPTENALVAYAARLGLPKKELAASAPRVGEAPFDSQRKLMSTLHRVRAGVVQYTKGAPDELLKRCSHLWDGAGAVPLTDALRADILSQNTLMAGQALRVMAGAFREWDDLPRDQSPQHLERALTFIGLVGMVDPVRPEVIPAMAECRQAGIRPIMITGDHRETAAAIAKQLGMISTQDEAITGAQLDQISDEQLARDIANYAVYARVQPEHKVRIVTAWQAQGKVTAMTGDGVNDAPSIKKADIGVGMGITGTDVTKNVADMVLADDNFATIVSAVKEGRRIYDNIRKAIQFLISSNLSEVISIFTATIIGFIVLKPVHILWINLITDTFPALALSFEAPGKDVMSRPPRPKNEGIFAGGLGIDAVYQGLIVSILTLFSFLLGHYMESGLWEYVNSPDGMTMAFLTMSLAEVFHSFNMRSQRGSLLRIKGHNLYLYGAAAFSLVLTLAVIYVPFLRDAFGFEHISFVEYAAALGLALTIVPLVEGVKFLQRRLGRKSA